MSHGGWEVVGKNKKEKSNGKPVKLSKAEKKKFIENAPKLEDFRKFFFFFCSLTHPNLLL